MKKDYLLTNNNGSVIVLTMVMLVLLTLLGIAATTTSTIEVEIAGTERFHKVAFYNADGGLEVGQELLELNVACPSGFASDNLQVGNTKVIDRIFWMQTDPPPVTPFPSDIERDVHIPFDDSGLHTNLTIFGSTVFGKGGAIQMAAGYEGKGKGTGGGGAHILYEIYSQRRGSGNNESLLMSQWRHVIGQEDECKY